MSLLAFGALPVSVAADNEPARGMLLVATELVRGAEFQESVVLLLHYDSNGALGLIVNRRTGVHPEEALSDLEGIEDYDGNLYFGGPVATHTLRALMRASNPPEESTQIVGDVYIVSVDENILDRADDDKVLRFYFGYAGWAPQQLDAELEQGSWHVVPASAELVFAPAGQEIWHELIPPRSLRVMLVGGYQQ